MIKEWLLMGNSIMKAICRVSSSKMILTVVSLILDGVGLAIANGLTF